MNLSPILKRFVDKAPLPVMMRAVLERELDAAQFDRWFETVAQQQYTRTLLLSTLFELTTQVVLRQSGSIREAWLQAEGDVGVSLASVYNKLNGLEVGTSAALVAFAAQRSREMIEAMVPCEDGHAQERRLLGQIGPLVGAGQVWLADRNFCTEGFFSDLSERGAYSLIREHDNLRFTPLQATHSPVRCDAQGCVVSEQWVQLKSRAEGQDGLKMRRIRIQPDTPTRHGENGLYLLSTVPEAVADASTLAGLYGQRWTIERAFLHLTVQLRCEVNTLSYPLTEHGEQMRSVQPRDGHAHAGDGAVAAGTGRCGLAQALRQGPRPQDRAQARHQARSQPA